MTSSSDSIRTAFKQKLKDRYEHLTEADLAEFNDFRRDWVSRLHKRVGGSLFMLAHLAEEAALEQRGGPTWIPRKDHERSCA